MATAQSLISADVKSKVSSVLNRNAKMFGKQNMFDQSQETCWNSDQGSPQYVVLEFPEPVNVESLQIMFQGGFVGKNCQLLGLDASSATKTFVKLMGFYPEDSNALCSFQVPTEGRTMAVKQLQILFPESTDFYGRIVIYKLDVLGHKA